MLSSIRSISSLLKRRRILDPISFIKWVVLLLLVCLSSSSRTCTLAWMLRTPAVHHPVPQRQARRGGATSSSALASSSSIISTPPPSSTTRGVLDTSSAPWGQQQPQQPQQLQQQQSFDLPKTAPPPAVLQPPQQQADDDRSAYLDPETVQQTVATVFPSFFESSTTTHNTPTDEGPVYLFDGQCNFCDATVHFCYDHDTTATLRFAPLQSPTGRALLQHLGRHPDDTSSLVLVVNPHTCYDQSDAVLHTAQHLSGLPLWVRRTSQHALAYLPRALRNRVYQTISQHRHQLDTVRRNCRWWNRHSEEKNEDEVGPQCRVDLDPTRFLDQVGP